MLNKLAEEIHGDNDTWVIFSKNPNYEVSDLGKVRNIHTKKNIIPRCNGTNRYKKVTLGCTGLIGIKNTGQLKTKSYFVHYLVLFCFVGERPTNNTINHLNSIRTDNRLVNLEYVTPKENTRHAILNGFDPRIHKTNKLTYEKAENIRKMHKTGTPIKDIASEFKISIAHTKDVINNKKWRTNEKY